MLTALPLFTNVIYDLVGAKHFRYETSAVGTHGDMNDTIAETDCYFCVVICNAGS